MTAVYLLIPLGLVLAGFAVWAFFWAVNSGQFEDLEHASDSVIRPDATPSDPPPADRVA